MQVDDFENEPVSTFDEKEERELKKNAKLKYS
jgi:hypothetical protein